MIRSAFLLLLAVTTSPVLAHTLGVDKASLVELSDGSYHLISHVPPRYQPMITTPELPERCTLEGSPRGARGTYEVRFDPALVSPMAYPGTDHAASPRRATCPRRSRWPRCR